MRALSAIAEKFFSKDTKTLIKAGLINGENELTERAVDFLQALFAEQNKDKLVAYAKEILEEKKKKKK